MSLTLFENYLLFSFFRWDIEKLKTLILTRRRSLYHLIIRNEVKTLIWIMMTLFFTCFDDFLDQLHLRLLRLFQ